MADDTLIAVKVSTVAASDRKIHRRALSHAKFAALIAATDKPGEAFGMSGTDRAMVYRVAGNTGFRQGELRTLMPESFDLNDTPATITVKAAYSKRRRDNRQAIPVALAEKLKPWLHQKAAGKPVFALPPRFDVADMFRADLQAAGVSTADTDFHCLRVSYVSWLVQSGASVKTCQELARHSTPVLTISLYSRMTVDCPGRDSNPHDLYRSQDFKS